MLHSPLSIGHAAIALSLALVSAFAHAESPYATTVISYDPGTPTPPLTDPTVALGEPSRFTGVGLFPAVVSPFNPPWTDEEIVSIGPGGHLVVAFDSPILNEADHPFGIDLLVFGNTGFIDANWPSAIVGGLFGADGGMIELSADGETWFTVPGVKADGPFPTLGYLDAGAYDTEPGRVESDFTRPVDPALMLEDFIGLTYPEVLALYDGSGGGAGVDIGAVGLSEVHYVRIANPPGASASIEIDAFAKVSPVIAGDLTGDGSVGVDDLLLMLASWGACADCAECQADLTGDCTVSVDDLLVLLANWSE